MYLGTFDISILELGDGVFEVKSTNGNTHLGGDDFDKKIIDWLADEFKNDEGIDLRKDPMAHQRLKEAAEKAKIELSASTQAEINLPYITAVDGMPKHLVKTLTRAKFEQLIDSLIQDSIDPCRKALEDANLKPSDIDEVLLVGGSTRVPAVQEAVKKFFGKEPSKNVNPDEAVAVGAAIQGGILAGEVNDVLLLDVTPLSLGIETMGGVMTKLVDANTTIPTRKSQIFSTAEDNQPAVDIHVLQGERPMARDNKTIGIFKLDGIAPAMRGVPQIEVTFDIDANGILNVSATDKGTGKEQHITIDNKNSLTPEEIEKAKADAEKYKEEDEKRQKEAQEINNAEQFVYAVEKSMKDDAYKDKFTEEDKTALNEKIESTKKVLENKNVDEIKTAMEELHKVYDPIIERIYKAANPQPEGGAAGTEAFNNMFGDNNPFANAAK